MASRAAAARPPAGFHAIWRTTTRFARTWPYLVPALVFFVGWQLWPIIRALWISFTSFSFLLDDSPESAHWIWFHNYVEALKDPLVRTGLWHAAIFTAIFLPGMVFLPMVTAVLLDRVRNQKIATTYRLILLIPAMIPGPLIFILWVWMYSNGIGPINHVLVDTLGVYDLANQPTWLGSTNTTFVSLALMEWWWGLGFHTMFYLAGLSTIPKELYESARVDGASEWRIFWRITFPRLRPILLVLVVLRFGTAYALIDEYILTGGFDRSKPTYTWTVYMWDTAFQVGDQNRGYAAAIGWIGTIGMLAVVLWLFYALQEQGLMATRVETERIAARRRVPPRRRARIPWTSIAKHGILILLCVVILFPLFWVFMLSIKSLPDAYTNDIWPKHFDFGSYRTALTAIDTLPQNIENSVILTLSTMLITTTIAVLAGYALVHLPTPGKALVLGILVASLFVPSRVTGLISIWEIQDRLGLINSTWGLILPYQTLALAVSIFIMRGVFETIPRELPGVRARRRRELVHDPAPHHAAARAQRRHRRPAHQLHRGVGRVAAREHAHERPGQADADGRDRVGERGLRTVAVADDGGDVRGRDPARPDRSSSS